MNFGEIGLKDLARVGGKNVSLGELFNSLAAKGVGGVIDGFADHCGRLSRDVGPGANWNTSFARLSQTSITKPSKEVKPTKAVIGLTAAGATYVLIQKTRHAISNGATGHAEIHGFVISGYEAVREAFAENFSTRRVIGAACCVYHKGEKVVPAEPWQVVEKAPSNNQRVLFAPTLRSLRLCGELVL